MKNDKKEAATTKTSGDAKGKASFDQNGQGAAPKYGQAGDKPNESSERVKKGKS